MANFDWKACIEAELEAAKAHGMEGAILKIVSMEEGNDKEEAMVALDQQPWRR